MANENRRLQRLKAYAAAYLAFWLVFNVPQLRAAVLDSVQQYASQPPAAEPYSASEGTNRVSAGEKERLPVGSRPAERRGRALAEVAYAPLSELKTNSLPTRDVLVPMALLLIAGSAVAPAVSLAGILRRRRSANQPKSGPELRREPRNRTRLRNGVLLDKRGRELCACSVLDRSEHGARIRLDRTISNLSDVQFHDEGAGITYKAQVAWVRGQEIGLALEIPAEPDEPELLRIAGRIPKGESPSAEALNPNAQPDPRWHVELWDPASGSALFNASYMELDELLEGTRPYLEDQPQAVPKIKAPTLVDEAELAKLEEIGAELV